MRCLMISLLWAGLLLLWSPTALAANGRYIRVVSMNRYTVRVENVSAFDLEVRIGQEQPRTLQSGGSLMLDRSEARRDMAVTYTRHTCDRKDQKLRDQIHGINDDIVEIEAERRRWEATIDQRTEEVLDRLTKANEAVLRGAGLLSDTLTRPTVYSDNYGNYYIEQPSMLGELLTNGLLAWGAQSVIQANNAAAKKALARPNFEDQIEKKEARITSLQTMRETNRRLRAAAEGQRNDLSAQLATVSLSDRAPNKAGHVTRVYTTVGATLWQNRLNDQWSGRGDTSWHADLGIGVLPELRLGGKNARLYSRLFLTARYDVLSVGLSANKANYTASNDAVSEIREADLQLRAAAPGLSLRVVHKPAWFVDLGGGMHVYIDNQLNASGLSSVGQVVELAPLAEAWPEHFYGAARLGLHLGDKSTLRHHSGFYWTLGAKAHTMPTMTASNRYDLTSTGGDEIGLPPSGALVVQGTTALGLSF